VRGPFAVMKTADTRRALMPPYGPPIVERGNRGTKIPRAGPMLPKTSQFAIGSSDSSFKFLVVVSQLDLFPVEGAKYSVPARSRSFGMPSRQDSRLDWEAGPAW